MGSNYRILGFVFSDVKNGAKVTIGDNFLFLSGNNKNPLSPNIRGSIVVEENARLSIGDNVGVSSSSIWCHEEITIGNDVKIGAGTKIIDSDCHSLNYYDRRFVNTDTEKTKHAPITIDDDVLIGTSCIILKGVHIGARSVIGAGSVVTKDVPSDCIAAGNPCKVIKLINKE